MNIMVQIFKETLLTSLILFLMTACSDDKKELKIIVEPTSFHFEQTGGSKKFGITPNEPATFQSSEAWCKVTSESSTPVQAIYNITVEPNYARRAQRHHHRQRKGACTRNQRGAGGLYPKR